MASIERRPRRVIRIPLKKIIKVILIMGIIVALGWLAFNFFYKNNVRYAGQTSESIEELVGFSTDVLPNEEYYPTGRGYSNSDITDTREFMKVTYSAEIKTRDVSDVVKDIKGAVREVEGRVDKESSSEKRGYVSFVVPKSRFEEFRYEIESIAHRKLYTETVSSENLLREKQGIEQQMGSATSSLASLEQQKQSLDARHTQNINSITRELVNVRDQLEIVRTNIQSTEDEADLAYLRTQESTLLTRESLLVSNLNQENRSYATQSQNLIAQINQAKNIVEHVEDRDDQFTNTIETVSGWISVEWISVWGLAVVFSPLHPIFILIILILIIWWYLGRKGYRPRFEFV